MRKLTIMIAMIGIVLLVGGCAGPVVNTPASSESGSVVTTENGTPRTGGMFGDFGNGNRWSGLSKSDHCCRKCYLPFNYISIETGEPGGWDYDTWREICTRLHCVPVFVEAAWDGMIQAVSDGQYDVAADGITNTPERQKIVDFFDWVYPNPTTPAGSKRGKPFFQHWRVCSKWIFDYGHSGQHHELWNCD